MLFGARRLRGEDQKLSLYLIHTRLFAQGVVVGALTATLAANMVRTVAKKDKDE